MPKWVRLRHPEGGFYDSALGFGLKRNERKQLPEHVPPGSLTAQRIKSGAIVYCDPPADQPAEEAAPDPEATDEAVVPRGMRDHPDPLPEGEVVEEPPGDSAEPDNGEECAPSPDPSRQGRGIIAEAAAAEEVAERQGEQEAAPAPETTEVAPAPPPKPKRKARAKKVKAQ